MIKVHCGECKIPVRSVTAAIMGLVDGQGVSDEVYAAIVADNRANPGEILRALGYIKGGPE